MNANMFIGEFEGFIKEISGHGVLHHQSGFRKSLLMELYNVKLYLQGIYSKFTERRKRYE